MASHWVAGYWPAIAETGDALSVVDLADAVAAELNSAPDGTFAMAFTAVRQSVPRHSLESLTDLTVTVVPKGVERMPITRALAQHRMTVDVGVQKRTSDTEADVEAMVALIDAMADYLNDRTLAQAQNARWIDTEDAVVYAVEHLQTSQVFTGVLTLTYSILRGD